MVLEEAENAISMGFHLEKKDRAELLSLLNIEEPKPFEDEEPE